MLIPQCDKCHRQGQIITVLGKDICVTYCVPKLRDWLEVQQKTPRLYPSERLEQVRKLVARHGYATAKALADVTGERLGTAHEALRSMAERGEVSRLGRGKYGLAVLEAAE